MCPARLIAMSCLVLGASGIAGCGLTFRPGFSIDDPEYFAEHPYVVARKDPTSYALRWRYGHWGFYFFPDSKVIDGKLVFALTATSSTGAT